MHVLPQLSECLLVHCKLSIVRRDSAGHRVLYKRMLRFFGTALLHVLRKPHAAHWILTALSLQHILQILHAGC